MGTLWGSVQVAVVQSMRHAPKRRPRPVVPGSAVPSPAKGVAFLLEHLHVTAMIREAAAVEPAKYFPSTDACELIKEGDQAEPELDRPVVSVSAWACMIPNPADVSCSR